MSGRKKRFWSEDEKREICDQATTPGISVAQVARRNAVNANLIHKWLKDPRFAPPAATVEDNFDIACPSVEGSNSSGDKEFSFGY